jgi:EAL domain-containing protein (putative c-di-GMP-specific phosphodiesterase class I)
MDRSFVIHCREGGSINIVRAVGALAQGLGIQATAEGVETQQRQAIKAEECSEMPVSCSAARSLPTRLKRFF